MRLTRSKQEFETKMDLTPLIDAVFLLIMFFILTTEITVKIEDVVLPFALEGRPEDPKAQELTLIVNVVTDKKAEEKGESERAGIIRYEGEDVTGQQLEEELRKEVAYDVRPVAQGGRGASYEPGPGGINLSRMELLIRIDQNVRAEYLRTVFDACRKVGIYKIKIASTQPPNR